MNVTFTTDPNIASAINQLFKVYTTAGFKCFLVGGAVRDIMCNQTPKDFDFATNAPFDFTKSAFEKTIDTGIDHGTITVMVNDNAFEVTRFRTDMNHNGRHCDVKFAATIEEDLSRRDFTFNAMAMDANGSLIDPFNGADDLKDGIVKFVGSADQRIREDYLRILRWFRFMARFGDLSKVDAYTFRCIRQNADGLRRISRERVWSEISRIVAHENGPELMTVLFEMGIAQHIDMHPFRDPGAIQCLRDAQQVTNAPELLLAAWLGWSVPNVSNIARNWKWSGAEAAHAVWMANNFGQSKDLRRLIAIENTNRDWVVELAALEQRDGWEQNALAFWEFAPFPVNGNDLIEAGIKPGLAMGVMLRELKEAWFRSDYSATKEELMAELSKV